MTAGLVGILCGLLAALGLVLAISGSPLQRRVTLDARLGPYLRDSPRASRLLQVAPSASPFTTLERVLRPVLGDAARLLERYVGGSSSVRRKLDRLGRGQTIEEFRAEQVVWATLGGAVAVGVVLLLLAAGGGVNPLSALLLLLVGVVGGVFGRDWWLGQQVQRRERAILAEFPTVAELLALAVAAGEGPIGAMERVSRLSSGELTREFALALGESRSGTPLAEALQHLADRTALEELARFIDGMVIAIDRGTPLADVLRAQAVDVRETGKRALLEAGGRKEIAMMVPVVFLVLPVTVVFALFPGLFSIITIAG
jgi:tight adherence protein C